MQVKTLLQRKGSLVITVDPDKSIRVAVGELVRNQIGALVVAGPDRSIEGMISERDVVRALDVRGVDVLDMPIRAFMSTGIHTCSPDDDVNSLMKTMTNERVRHLPVVSGSSLVGIVSIGDVVKTTMEDLEQDRDALVSYISAR